MPAAWRRGQSGLPIANPAPCLATPPPPAESVNLSANSLRQVRKDEKPGLRHVWHRVPAVRVQPLPRCDRRGEQRRRHGCARRRGAHARILGHRVELAGRSCERQALRRGLAGAHQPRQQGGGPLRGGHRGADSAGAQGACGIHPGAPRHRHQGPLGSPARRQLRRPPAREGRLGGAGRRLRASGEVRRQRAGRTAGFHAAAGPFGRRARGCPHRRQGTRRQARRGRHGCARRLRHRGGRPLWGSVHDGVDSRSARRPAAIRRHSRAGGRRHRHRAADGGGDGDGRRRRLVRLGVAHHRGGGNRPGREGEDARRELASDGAFTQPHRQIHPSAPLRLDGRLA